MRIISDNNIVFNDNILLRRTHYQQIQDEERKQIHNPYIPLNT